MIRDFVSGKTHGGFISDPTTLRLLFRLGLRRTQPLIPAASSSLPVPLFFFVVFVVLVVVMIQRDAGIIACMGRRGAP